MPNFIFGCGTEGCGFKSHRSPKTHTKFMLIQRASLTVKVSICALKSRDLAPILRPNRRSARGLALAGKPEKLRSGF